MRLISNSGSPADQQERARQMTKDAAVERRYREKRLARAKSGSRADLLSEKLEDLDWEAAEREVRGVRCVGRQIQ
jgi:hypothetical protein